MDAHPTVPSFLLAKPGTPGMPSIANATKLTKQQQVARDTAEKFESVFLQQMLEHMFSGIQPDPEFGGGQSELVYRSMLNEYYADAVSKRGGIGIADAVYNEIIRLQGQQDPTTVNAHVKAQAESLIKSQYQSQAAGQELK
jgi:Rod binding domain-containing protein